MLSKIVVPSWWRWPDTRVYATDTGIRRTLEGKNHDSWIDSLISRTESVNINTRHVIWTSLTRFLCSSVVRGSTFGLGARLDPGVSPTSPLILTQKNRQQNLYTLVLWILKPACYLLSFYSRPELLLCKRNLGFVVLRVLIKLTNVSALHLAARYARHPSPWIGTE